MVDYSELIGKIIAKYGTRDKFAKAIGMSNAALSARLNNKKQFTQMEILKISSPEILDIPLKLIGFYFFG